MTTPPDGHPADDLDTALAYARTHASSFLDALRDFLRIPSVSARPEHVGDVLAAAEWLAEALRAGGLENVRIYSTTRHPLVYGDWLHAPGAPTVLFYGHYDVQPADDDGQWKSPPFEPEIRKENIYARGASDDKGQVMILVNALASYLHTSGRLPVNVKLIFEGEEEISSASLLRFIPQQRDLLASDVAFVADTAMDDFGKPAIVYGLRGIAAVNIDVVGPRLDLHSGSFGGAIDNPIQVLAHILSALKDQDGHVNVPGFYDAVRPLIDEERALLNAAPMDEATWLAWTGAPQVWGEPHYALAERLGARPTLEINGIVGGYTGEGAKTIIPARAHAKITMRLVPDQNPQAIADALINYVAQLAPPTVTVSCTQLGHGPASISDINHPAMHAAAAACEAVFDLSPVYKREGGSIPVVASFQQELGLPVLLLGFGLPHDRVHAPNERFFLPNFYSGIETVIHFLNNYADNNAAGD